MRIFTREDFFRIEFFLIARDQRADDGMVGLEGLDKPTPRPVAATGATGHLLEELERAFGRARIAGGETDVGVDDADQRQMRKIMSFRHELRTDDDVEGAGRNLLDLAPQTIGPAGKVGGERERARLGEQRRDFFREPLDARPAGHERIGGLAFRAYVRPPLDMAAMVADQRATETVLDQPGRAVRALEAMAAGPAQGERREAAPVEEQQRLFLARDGLGHRLRQHR